MSATTSSPGTARIAGSITELIGRTPLVRLRIGEGTGATILGKLESFNPAGSVKDRIALSMIEAAERDGRLHPGDTIVEPTSGNTGVGLAMVAAVKGYRLILTMPEDYSLERRKLFMRFGAQLKLTPAIEGMTGAVYAAEGLIAEHPNYFMPQQFTNPANPEAHHETTGDPPRHRWPDRRLCRWRWHRWHDHRRRASAKGAVSRMPHCRGRTSSIPGPGRQTSGAARNSGYRRQFRPERSRPRGLRRLAASLG